MSKKSYRKKNKNKNNSSKSTAFFKKVHGSKSCKLQSASSCWNLNYPKNGILGDLNFFSVSFVNGRFCIFTLIVLVLASIIAFAIRCYSVLLYESIIHEYDPWYNYRVTKFIVKNGFRSFFNWYDEKTWYPYGRDIFRTTYFGMMFTAASIYHVLRFLRVSIHIREVCVFLGPIISVGTVLTTFFIAKECWDSLAGSLAALFVASVPGYISRSVAGSYDYECIAIFAMTLSFLVWLKAMDSNSVTLRALCGMAYFYMVSVWGGYLFVLNLIAVHVCTLIGVGGYNKRVYRAYSIFYVVGNSLTVAVPIVSVGYFKKITHLPAFGVFILLQIHEVSNSARKHCKNPFKVYLAITLSLWAVITPFLSIYLSPEVAGRVYQILGLRHGISLVSSVSEHRRANWADIKESVPYIVYLIPLGTLFLLLNLNSKRVFILLYLFFSGYFAYTMVRVMLVFAPVVCIVAGIGISGVFGILNRRIKSARGSLIKFLILLLSLSLAGGFVYGYTLYAKSCVEKAHNLYSHPSVIYKTKNNENETIYVDDLREALLWLKYNTPSKSKVLSWWDYGYQITGFTDRTVYVDGNTRDNDHIARIGMILASNENESYKEMLKLDVDYVLVIFGGKIGFSSDDIGKSYWIFKIAADKYPRLRGIYPKNVKNTILFKMCYYRFDSENNGGYDMARRLRFYQGVDIKFRHFEEVYTSKNWMVRLYKVKKP